MLDYKLLGFFLRKTEIAFSGFVPDASEFGKLADKFERGDATDEDRQLVRRILENADAHIRPKPPSAERDEVLLLINMLRAQMDIDLGALN